MYPNIFKNNYPPEIFRGSDWIRNVKQINPEDYKWFVETGLRAADNGKMGGHAVARKYGKKYMRDIARRGAIMTNLRKYWNKLLQEQLLLLEQEGGAS